MSKANQRQSELAKESPPSGGETSPNGGGLGPKGGEPEGVSLADLVRGAPLCVTDLVRDHHQAVYGYAFRLSGNAADAEDLSQQAFLIAHEKLTQLREPSKAKAWLLRIVRTCFLKRIRRLRPVDAGSLKISLDDAPDLSRAVSDIDEQRLHLGLASLSEEYRLVLVMFYFEDLSYREIAASLEMPIGTVMSRLSRAKQMLRRELQGTDVCVGANRTQITQTQSGNGKAIVADGGTSSAAVAHLETNGRLETGGERTQNGRA